MAAKLQQWKQDTWAWRLLGIALYHSIIVLAAALSLAVLSFDPWKASIAAFARPLISPLNWISLLSLCAIQVLVIAGMCLGLLSTAQDKQKYWAYAYCEANMCLQPKPHC